MGKTKAETNDILVTASRTAIEIMKDALTTAQEQIFELKLELDAAMKRIEHLEAIIERRTSDG